MYLDYINDILAYYRASETNASLPQRLMRPTPGSIKDECLAVCKTRFDQKDISTLTTFFEAENDRDKILLAIDRFNRDRFRPLVNFLKGATGSTDDLNIELLAWLIDFPRRPYKAEGYQEKPQDTSPGIQNNTVKGEIEAEQTPEEKLTTNNNEQNRDETGSDKAQKIERKFSNSKGIMAGIIILLILAGFFWGFRRVVPSTTGNINPNPGKPVKQTEKQLTVSPPVNNSIAASNNKVDRPVHTGEVAAAQNNKVALVSVNAGDYINENIPKSDIAILIINQSGSLVMALSGGIADMYRINNHSSTVTSLFLPKFISSTYMERLYQGDANLIDLLHLASHANYIVIGKYASDFSNGEFTKYVCTATLDIAIISCQTKQIQSAFSLVASNPYDDKIRAENGAKEKLLQDFKINHLPL
jgi:hypothetical protein